MSFIIPEGVTEGRPEPVYGTAESTIVRAEELMTKGKNDIEYKTVLVKFTTSGPTTSKGVAWENLFFLGDPEDPQCLQPETLRRRLGGKYGLKAMLDKASGLQTAGKSSDELLKGVVGKTVGHRTDCVSSSGEDGVVYMNTRIAEWFVAGERELVVMEKPMTQGTRSAAPAAQSGPRPAAPTPRKIAG